MLGMSRRNYLQSEIALCERWIKINASCNQPTDGLESDLAALQAALQREKAFEYRCDIEEAKQLTDHSEQSFETNIGSAFPTVRVIIGKTNAAAELKALGMLRTHNYLFSALLDAEIRAMRYSQL